MRLQKYIAQCGVCSRRKAEDLISAGRVTVNGVIAALGDSAEEGDAVALDGRLLSLPESFTYVMLHKPVGYVTTMDDPRGRPTAADLVRDTGKRLFPVGRLDVMSEGLLIMTDDGETANRLTHPSHNVRKTYMVWVRGEDAEKKTALLSGPLTYEGVDYSGGEVRLLHASKSRCRLELTIGEGKNREVRNMCAAAGLQVERLVRIAQGMLQLGDLPAGKWRTLTPKEIRWLQSLQ